MVTVTGGLHGGVEGVASTTAASSGRSMCFGVRPPRITLSELASSSTPTPRRYVQVAGLEEAVGLYHRDVVEQQRATTPVAGNAASTSATRQLGVGWSSLTTGGRGDDRGQARGVGALGVQDPCRGGGEHLALDRPATGREGVEVGVSRRPQAFDQDGPSRGPVATLRLEWREGADQLGFVVVVAVGPMGASSGTPASFSRAKPAGLRRARGATGSTGIEAARILRRNGS